MSKVWGISIVAAIAIAGCGSSSHKSSSSSSRLSSVPGGEACKYAANEEVQNACLDGLEKSNKEQKEQLANPSGVEGAP